MSSTRHAARRVRWAHLDPRPLTLDRTMARLLDVVTSRDLPGWRADSQVDPDGVHRVSITWLTPAGEYRVVEPWSRHAPRRIAAKVDHILTLYTTGRLRPARRTPTIREDRA